MAPADFEIFLRPMHPADLPRVVDLEDELFGVLAWSTASYQNELETPGRRYAVAVARWPGSGEHVVGYAGVMLGADAEVMTVGVDGAYQRRGIATRLVRYLLAAASRHGAERIILEVRADDEGAQELYLKTGFRPMGHRKGYYRQVGADAVVMARTLNADADEVRRASVLVEPSFLAAELEGAEPPIVLDVRWAKLDPFGCGAPEAFREGHIPGARLVCPETELSGPETSTSGKYPLPGPERLEESLQSWGVREGQPVVVTDECGGLVAARAWWLLRWAGYEDVRVLCGGTPGWREMELPLATGDAPPVARGDAPLPLAHGAVPGMGVTDVAEVSELAASGRLIDVRSAENFGGDGEDPQRGGHVPGAIHLLPQDFLDEDGHIADAPTLRALFMRAGLNTDLPDHRWTIQCSTGMTAPHAVLALEVLGAGLGFGLAPGRSG